MSRPLFAQINLAALAANLARARTLAPGTQVLAVVKADAYGHGLTRVLPALEQADGLALLELDAAVALRERHYTRRILLLEGFFEERELAEIAQRRLAIVVHHADQVAMLERAALARPLEVFVKVNTGMNRLGLPVGNVADVCERLSRCASVAALRLMTHLARAEDDDGLKDPLDAFESACKGLPVLVCGTKVRMAGRVSMDMVTVDLTEVPEARVGSPVVLWGEGLPVDDVANAASTVGYELLCAVAPRVPFVATRVGALDLEL